MQEQALRKVLLIQAIEETDRNGEALPLAERAEATRKVIGNNPPNVEAQAGAPLSSATEWLLVRRADRLLDALRARSPGIDHVLDVAGGAISLDRGMLVLAFVLGAILSFADGARGGINIFAAPLVLLLTWNILVYLVKGIRLGKPRIETTIFAGPAPAAGLGSTTASGAGSPTSGVSTGATTAGNVGSATAGDPAGLGPTAAAGGGTGGAPMGGGLSSGSTRAAASAAADAFSTRADRAGSTLDNDFASGAVGMVVARPSPMGRFYARWVRRQIDKLLGHSTRFNAPLTPGLRRFAADWLDLAQPLFFARARRLMHLSAIFAALGLIAAYYIRAFVLRSAAGWEGNGALGPETAHALLVVLYGPASLLSGISIPTADEIAKLRWSAPSLSGVGEPAIWVHLITLTAVLYIILPRLILTLAATFRLWRLSRRLMLPPGAANYVRTLIAAARST
jgi:hypothetical protein